jgi:Co/Zn/Cd efflux system component
MSAHCHDQGCTTRAAAASPAYRRVLCLALAVNAAMFAVEMGAGLVSGSVALLADALDFFADAANYAVSLWVLGLAAVWRSRAAQWKGWSLAVFGVLVLAKAVWSAWHGAAPEPMTMGVVGSLALGANLLVAVLLYRWREGDANMRSVWLCTRNDVLGNVAVLVAALGVFGSGSAWPDLAVAAVMGGLALMAAWTVIRQARAELRNA